MTYLSYMLEVAHTGYDLKFYSPRENDRMRKFLRARILCIISIKSGGKSSPAIVERVRDVWEQF